MHRHRFIPWIDSVVRLNNLTILEIGCGTGCATVAMAEQGSTVVALDVHREGLAVSQLRAQVHGLRNASFIHGNAENLEELTRHYQFDLILFHAVLEHMTLKERKAALQAAWGILRKGNYLCISDTPNRLWFFDGHTSRLPFFNWLPDELAFEYSSLSPRLPFNARFRNVSDEAMLSFIREGRGFSFHELDLALGDCSRYEVVSDLAEFVSLRYPAVALKRALEREGKRERLLNYYAPDRARGFFRQGINLVMQKLH
jgi:S-adenosylmethionine-dependent methyltransferase